MGNRLFMCAFVLLAGGVHLSGQSRIDPCVDYSTLDDFRRSPSYKWLGSDNLLCDNGLRNNRWYRFQINGSDAEMPNTCIKPNRCGTTAPIWLDMSEGHFPQPQQEVKGRACVSTIHDGKVNCCLFPLDVTIANCVGFFVYKLSRVGCPLSYCAQSKSCPDGDVYIPHLRTCVENRVSVSRPTVKVKVRKKKVIFRCKFKILDDVIAKTFPLFHVVWYKDDTQLTSKVKSKFTNKTSDNIKLWQKFVPGNQIICGVQPVGRGVRSEGEVFSKPYYVGVQMKPKYKVLAEHHGAQEVSIKSALPIPCNRKRRSERSKCTASMLLKTHYPLASQHPVLLLSSCLVRLPAKKKCPKNTCHQEIISAKVLPNMHSYSHVTINVTGDTYFRNGDIWEQTLRPRKIEIKDDPTQSCFLLSGGNILSMMKRSETIIRPGTYVLFEDKEKILEIHGRVYRCEDNTNLCFCGIIISYHGNLILYDQCSDTGPIMYFLRSGGSVIEPSVAVYQGRREKLIQFYLGTEARVRIDVASDRISVSIHVSGYFKERSHGVCVSKATEAADSSTGNELPDSEVLQHEWRIPPGQSYFDRFPTSLPKRGSAFCDCSIATVENPCPSRSMAPSTRNLHGLQDVTNDWSDLSSNAIGQSSYTFLGDFDSFELGSWGEEDADLRERANTSCKRLMSTAAIYDVCARFIDTFFLQFLELCIRMALKQRTNQWKPEILRVLESACEVSIETDVFEFSFELEKSFWNATHCPSSCYGNGKCSADGCVCAEGYVGIDCLVKEGRKLTVKPPASGDNGSTSNPSLTSDLSVTSDPSLTSPLPASPQSDQDTAFTSGFTSDLSDPFSNKSSVTQTVIFSTTTVSSDGHVTSTSPVIFTSSDTITEEKAAVMSTPVMTTEKESTSSSSTSSPAVSTHTQPHTTSTSSSPSPASSSSSTASQTIFKTTKQPPVTILETTTLSAQQTTYTTTHRTTLTSTTSSTTTSTSSTTTTSTTTQPITTEMSTMPTTFTTTPSPTSSTTVSTTISTTKSTTQPTTPSTTEPTTTQSTTQPTTHPTTPSTTQVIPLAPTFTKCERFSDQCTSMTFDLKDGLHDFDGGCWISEAQMKNTTWERVGPRLPLGKDMTSHTIAQCLIPHGSLGTAVYMVQMDDSRGHAVTKLLAPYDAACQDCTQEEGCVVKPGYCLIQRSCYVDGATADKDRCQICNASESILQWSPVRYPAPFVRTNQTAFSIVEGDTLMTNLTILNQYDYDVTISIDHPHAYINSGKTFIWTSTFDPYTSASSQLEMFVVLATNECRLQSRFILTVQVLKCPCQNGGECIPKTLAYNRTLASTECRCRIPFKGHHCDVRVSACASNPCHRGVACTDVGYSYSCGTCPDGMTGDGRVCSKTCMSSPCFPGVPCYATGVMSPAFQCGACPDFFEGDGITCRSNGTSICTTGVCSHLVTCHDTPTPPFYSCAPCPPGYHGNGTTCDVVCPRWCNKNQQCVAPGVCTCKPGFMGTFCQRRVCKPLCQHRGRCLSSNVCQCRHGYTGHRCEQPVCQQACMNGGRCVRPNRCKCPHGYRGQQCQRPICTDRCLHGGQCVGPNSCKCSSLYSGNRCEIPVCSPPCLNGGTCTRPGKCQCPEKFKGDNCEIIQVSSGGCPNNCSGHGICDGRGRCRCRMGYFGVACEYVSCWPYCVYGRQCRLPSICRCQETRIGRICQCTITIPNKHLRDHMTSQLSPVLSTPYDLTSSGHSNIPSVSSASGTKTSGPSGRDLTVLRQNDILLSDGRRVTSHLLRSRPRFRNQGSSNKRQYNYPVYSNNHLPGRWQSTSHYVGGQVESKSRKGTSLFPVARFPYRANRGP